MAIPKITVTFDPPLVTDSQDVFDTKAFDTVGKLNTLGSQLNDAIDGIDEAAEALNDPSVQEVVANIPAIIAAQSHATAAATSATQAGNQATASMSAAQAANAALLALGNALANGIGAFFVDGDGNLIAEYNAPTVTGMTIDGNGNLLVTY